MLFVAVLWYTHATRMLSRNRLVNQNLFFCVLFSVPPERRKSVPKRLNLISMGGVKSFHDKNKFFRSTNIFLLLIFSHCHLEKLSKRSVLEKRGKKSVEYPKTRL